MFVRFTFAHGFGDLGSLFLAKKGGRPPLRRYSTACTPPLLYRCTHRSTVSIVRPISLAHWVALVCPLAIIYKPRYRFRLLACVSLLAGSPQFLGLLPHFCVSR